MCVCVCACVKTRKWVPLCRGLVFVSHTSHSLHQTMLACRFNDPIKSTHHHTAGRLRANTHTTTQTNTYACGLAATLALYLSERALDQKKEKACWAPRFFPQPLSSLGTLWVPVSTVPLYQRGASFLRLVFIESGRGQKSVGEKSIEVF